MDSFGRIFRISLFGESHGPSIGVVIDGVKPGIALAAEDFARDIDRRRSGAKGTTPRTETDEPHILSGVYNGHATGAPIAIAFDNGNTHSSDYSLFMDVPRPGHADYTGRVKSDGFNDPRGGGHFSGRLTLPVVAAGVVAKKMLPGVDIGASLVEVGGCPDKALWDGLLDAAIKDGDSLGGIVECRVTGLPTGLGEPFFDSVESLISHAMFSIPGVRGVEFGDGFAAAAMRGSEHNDPLTLSATPQPNHAEGQAHHIARPAKDGAGGANGGITNGGTVIFRVAFKPTSSVRKAQTTLDVSSGKMTQLLIPGRHDVCFALRTPVIVEALAACVFADLSRLR